MEFSRNLLSFLVLMWFTGPAAGLYGYDCGDQISNLTTISLIDVGECDIDPPRLNISKNYVQLLQLNDYGMVKVIKCSIKITRIITHCGMHSHASRVRDGEISYYKDLTRDECLTIHNTGFISLAGTQILGIRRNSTLHKSLSFAGSSDHDGNCKGGSYTDPYGKWDDVYVAGWVEIAVSDYFTEVHLATNKIKLKSGVSCKLLDTYCIDLDAGYAFWSPLPADMCGTNKYSILYEGQIDKIYEEKENRVMYSLETNDITFALWKAGEFNTCGYTFSRTEHPKLFILENAQGSRLAKTESPATANLDIFAYVNSKFLYIEKFLRGQLNQMYYNVLKNKCELERKVLTNALSLATISPAEAGYKIMEQRGYLGVVTGEVIHLLKCLRVEITPRQTNECYDQLPVYRGKEEYFLSPRTRILLRTGTQIYCDRRLPAMFKIDTIWVRMLPGAIDAKDPEILKPQTKPTWSYHSPETLAMGGIYSEKDTNRLRDMILFPLEKGSVLNKVALGMSGKSVSNQGLSISSFLDKETLEALAESTWRAMWSNFLAFGTASAGLIGFIMICRLIKLLIDTVIHGYAIYSLYGFSLHLVGAVWNSVTQLLLHLGQQKDTRKEPEKETASDEIAIIKERGIPQKEHFYNKVEESKNRLYPEILIDENRKRDSL